MKMKPYKPQGAPVHKTNPFAAPKQDRQTLIYTIDEYTLNTLVSLCPDANRVLYIISYYYDPVTGYADCPFATIKKHLNKQSSCISKAIAELITHQFIAKRTRYGTWFLNTNVFRPVGFTL